MDAGELRAGTQWSLLLGLSAVLASGFSIVRLPAALMLGPMIGGILVTACGGRIRVPRFPFLLAQGLVGCLIARMMPDVLDDGFGGHWGIFLAGTVATFAASFGLCWLMIRLRVLPGATVLWGISPGAANVMILMAEAYGADAQLVAFMQYLRVVVVTGAATLVAHIWTGGSGAAPPAAVWFGPVDWLSLLETVALAVAGPLLAERLRFSAGGLLIPLAAAMVLSRYGLMTIELPRWLLVFAYALIGWRIGLRFTRPLLLHAARAFPRILVATLALTLVCALIGMGLGAIAGVDPLTAYLSTSPGGADTVAIIAASSNVDAHFVMGMQSVRFVAVLVVLPVMSRWIAERTVYRKRG